MTTTPRHLLVLGGTALALLPLSACTDNSPSDTATGAAGALTVAASDSACEVSAGEAPSGTLRFTVTNSGDQVTEFYLLAEDGLRIVGEVENIAPGLSRDLVLAAPPGEYVTACKPGMVGDGLRADFTVTDSGADLSPSGDDEELVEAAATLYAAYVKDQTEQLLTATTEFRDLYVAGDDDAARALYPQARTHWERIETVAESFGDLDPRMDAREADLVEGEAFTGWHRIEKDLWPEQAEAYTALDVAGRTEVADLLVADTTELYDRTRDMTFTVDQISNGSKGLLDEVATGKVTGEEEFLVAHGPVGLPGQRRRGEGRLRRGRAAAADEGRGVGRRAGRPVRRAAGAAGRAALRRRVRAVLRPGAGGGAGAVRRRQRPGRAAVPADRSRAGVTSGVVEVPA